MTDSERLPWITIVTPSFNQARFLRATIDSVLSQGYPRLSYVVMDGGSRDGSVDILREYADRLTHWESGPDGGQAAAIRRGIELGGGDIINWLNSDDHLEPGALWRVAELAVARPSASILAFPVRDFMDTEEGMRELAISVPRALALDNMLLVRRPRPRRHQPGMFLRREAYDRVGGLNPALHICMDFDLHLRMLADGGEVAYGQGVVANFRRHAGAKTATAANVLVFVEEYAGACALTARDQRTATATGPLAPLVLAAMRAALASRSPAEFRRCLRAVRRIGVVAMVVGCVTFAVRRYLLGDREELP